MDLAELVGMYTYVQKSYKKALRKHIVENKAYDEIEDYIALLGCQREMFNVVFYDKQEDGICVLQVGEEYWKENVFDAFDKYIVEICDLLSEVSGMDVTSYKDYAASWFYGFVYNKKNE